MIQTTFYNASAAAASLALFALWYRNRSKHHHLHQEDNLSLLEVNAHNQELAPHHNNNRSSNIDVWHRAAYCLIIHEPPEQYYEPRDWAHTQILLVPSTHSTTASSTTTSPNISHTLVSQKVHHYQNYQDTAIQALLLHGISVHQPENCLHHLFTFPLAQEKIWGDFYECIYRGPVPHTLVSRLLVDIQQELLSIPDKDVCDASSSAARKTNFFSTETAIALKLYFQRQGDLRTQRRLLKNYPTTDLQHYGLRRGSSGLLSRSNSSSMGRMMTTTTTRSSSSNPNLRQQKSTRNPSSSSLLGDFSSTGAVAGNESSHNGSSNSMMDMVVTCSATSTADGNMSTPSSKHEHEQLLQELHPGKVVVFLDGHDSQRQAAVEYTLQTDDGQSPKLLPQADIVLLGVSRAGKTPLSLYIAQTSGLKVANIPLVQELPPPTLLNNVNPKRIFCLTMNADRLVALRRTRFRREMKHFSKERTTSRPCIYANADYVAQDLAYARDLAREHGYTELNMTNRAMEEVASLIVSKMKERFPDMHII